MPDQTLIVGSLQPALLVALCWLLFAATHIGMAVKPVRERLVARLGRKGFTYLFSFVAFVTFGVLVHVLAIHQETGAAGPDLGRIAAIQGLGIAISLLGIVLTIAAFQTPPVSALALFIRRGERKPYGLERITRHPLFVGAAMIGVGHLLLASHLVGVVAFGGLALYSIAGALHQDMKLEREMGDDYRDYRACTSVAPFAAIVSGRQKLEVSELPLAGLVIGTIAAVAAWIGHASLLAAGGAWAITVMIVGPVTAAVIVGMHRRREKRNPNTGEQP